MKRLLLIAFIALALSVLLRTAPGAQMRVVPVDEERGHVALALALRHLGNTGIFMNATAHPDDEDNGLLVMLNRGLGYRTALATATRGNGGQNEIGPEIFEALGVLRTEELGAMHRFDGAEQYFTRAVDFGYSFSVEETFEKWGRDEILADFVRLIRTIRPDVILSLSPEGNSGGLHHQASAIIVRDAFKQAGDATKFPEQIKEGLRAWQPRKLYTPPGPASRVVTMNLSTYDSLLGKSYAEIGLEARSMHKCQGQAQLSEPSPVLDTFQLVETTIGGQLQRDERSIFDGVDGTLTGLAQFAGPKPPRDLTESLSAIQTAVDAAQKRFTTEGDAAAMQPLLTGLRAVRVARAVVRNSSLNETARFEIEFRLRQKEREFQQTIILAGGFRLEALADDGVVVPGQPVKVSLSVANGGTTDATVKQVKFDGFDGDSGCTLALVAPRAGRGAGGGRGRGLAPAGEIVSTLHKDQVARCELTLRVKANERPTEPYWHRAGEAGRYTFDDDASFGLPYRYTPFYVQVTLAIAGAANEDVIGGMAVQYRYQGDIFSGEKRSELLVVPALSVRVSPEVAIVPAVPDAPAPARGVTTSAAPAAGRGGAVATTGRGRGAVPARGSTTARGAAAPPPPPPPVLPGREIRVTVVN